MNSPVLELSEIIEYSNEGAIPVADIIASLRAIERLTGNFVPRALGELTGTDILAIELLVEGFEEGSFKESFVCRVVFGNQKSYDQFIGKLHKGELRSAIQGVVSKWGSSMSPTQKTVAVTVVIALLVGAGLVYASQLAGTDQAGTALIEGNNNVVIAIGADAFGKSPEEVSRIIGEVTSGQKRRIAKEAITAISPAKREPGASMVLGDGQHVVIQPDVVAAAPSDVAQDPYEMEQVFRDVDLQIRATDLDSTDKGWAALIPGLIDRRVRLVLSDGVNVADVAGRFSIRADVEVLYRMDQRSKQMKPQQITVIEIIKEDEALPADGE